MLFDAATADLAGALLRSTGGNTFALRRAGEAAVGAGLVTRLPAFPTAPMDELIDLRLDLSAPLRRYRAAVLDLAQALEPGLGAELDLQVDDLWDNRVGPALEEIHESLGEHGLVREVAKHASQDVKSLLLTGSALYLGMTAAASLEAASALALTAGGGVLPSVIGGAWNAHDGRRAVAKQELFYLYEAQRRLG